MADQEIENLPLKSLQLPTKTVGKLKPLGLKTVRDLLALSIADLVAVGLVERELVEIAEAASDFHMTWSTPDQVRAELTKHDKNSGIDAPTKSSEPKKSTTKSMPKAAKGSLPEKVLEVFRSDPTIASPFTASEIHAIASKETELSFTRLLPLLRRMRIQESATIGGAGAWFCDALLDVSQLAVIAPQEVTDFLLQCSSVFADALEELGVKRMSSSMWGNNIVFAITAKGLPKARQLVEAQRAWIADGPTHLRPLEYFWIAIATRGALLFDDPNEALALARRLLPIDPHAAESTRVDQIYLVSEAFRRAGHAADGVRALGDSIGRNALAAVGGASEEKLLAVAHLFADANRLENTVETLRLLFKYEAAHPKVLSPRAQALDDPLFEKFHSTPEFRALFKGYPVFEARLR